MELYQDQTMREDVIRAQGGICAVTRRTIQPEHALLVLMGQQVKAVHFFAAALCVAAVRDAWVKRTGWILLSVGKPATGEDEDSWWPKGLPENLRGWWCLAQDLDSWQLKARCIDFENITAFQLSTSVQRANVDSDSDPIVRLGLPLFDGNIHAFWAILPQANIVTDRALRAKAWHLHWNGDRSPDSANRTITSQLASNMLLVRAGRLKTYSPYGWHLDECLTWPDPFVLASP